VKTNRVLKAQICVIRLAQL